MTLDANSFDSLRLARILDSSQLVKLRQVGRPGSNFRRRYSLHLRRFMAAKHLKSLVMEDTSFLRELGIPPSVRVLVCRDDTGCVKMWQDIMASPSVAFGLVELEVRLKKLEFGE